jgi:putative transposase
VVVSKMELYELLRKAEGADVDFLREGVRTLAQALMEVEVSAQIGAERGERSPQRVTQRNGYRVRDWDTRVGTVELQVPKLRSGSYFPSLLEPRRRAERALAAVVAQC